VRQVGSGEHEITRLELADEVADKVATARRYDLMDLVFRVKVPPDGVERIAVRPSLERLITPSLGEFDAAIDILSQLGVRRWSLLGS